MVKSPSVTKLASERSSSISSGSPAPDDRIYPFTVCHVHDVAATLTFCSP